ncbi:semaphorin-7A [Pholidichthys leucotaenia]
MGRFHFIHASFGVGAFLSFVLSDTPILGCSKSPRLVIEDIFGGAFKYDGYQNHSVLFCPEDSRDLYVGGTDLILKLDVDDHHIKAKFHLNTTCEQQSKEEPCKNVITVIEWFENSLFVCGTNGYKPQCWRLNNQSYEVEKEYEGTGISPFDYSHNSLSLTVEGDLYAAAPLDVHGSTLQFRRKAGKQTSVWMQDNWVSEPTFISASWIKRKDDPDNEKIYVFFREKNSDSNPEADPWISRVARVCKVDEGGSKRFFQNIWTSFLKARLVCGFPEQSLYFNRLQDVYIMEAENWQETRIYALFTSSWNSTAVCIYSITTIEGIFRNSSFKGYNGKIPTPRPGMCVKNSKTLPRETVTVVKDYPEMTQWVRSLHYKAPFFISSNNYTKIVVDQVKAADQRDYNVLLLATDSGKIHKVLEAGTEPFIISETQLPNSSPVHALKLDSKKKKLVVAFSERIYTVDLQRCQQYKQYNKSCEECVLARDPYCSWISSECAPTVPGAIQNVIDGNTTVCATAAYEQKPGNRSRREISSASQRILRPNNHSVPFGVPVYLSCPIDSYHASYTWEHGGRSSPCSQMLSNCVYLIPSVAPENYGNYSCVSTEKDYTKVVIKYKLLEQTIPEGKKGTKSSREVTRNQTSSLFSELVWITLLIEVLISL